MLSSEAAPTVTDGVILVDKPAGLTSHDVVSRVRRAFRQKRVGHAGTLDPPATGLMVVLLGLATRLQQYASGEGKTYEFDLVLGVATDTLDLAGAVLREEPVPDDAAERLEGVLPRFVGEVALVPPMVSALHHEGKRLYEIARAGETVEREARVSTIASLVTTGPSAREGERLRVSLRVVCSSGTYVRSLGEALAAELDLPGAVDRLRRTTVGRFRVEDASTLEEIAADRDAIRVLEPEVLAEGLPLAELSAEDAARFLHGNPVTWSGEAEGEVRVRASGRFLGIGVAEEGRLRPTRVLADREDPADA